MPRERTIVAKKYLIAFSAFWLLFCAFGSSFLHESIGCSHDGSAETVEHHEEDEAHWAAVTSDDFSNADCPVCITTEAFGIDDADAVTFEIDFPSQSLDDTPDSTPRDCRRVIGSPRAPPAFSEI
jgi:hypothetical protein